MKVLQETVEMEKYLEVALSDFDMDLLDDQRILSKEIKIGKTSYQFCIRKETQEEKYAPEER